MRHNAYGVKSIALVSAALIAGLLPGSIVRASDDIFAWGRNTEGQCNVPSPNSCFTAVAAGWLHSMGLKVDGSIVAWGGNVYGQCAVPTPNTDFVAIDAGEFHNLGLKADGSIVAWGYNYYGQCTVPSPNAGFIAVGGGSSHSLGLKANGSIVAWGLNSFGISTVPSPNTDFVAIAAGGTHSLGLKSDGSIVAWGKNYDGQCSVPSPNTEFVAVECGGTHSLGLKSDGTIVAWGYNGDGQCDVPSPNTNFIAVEGGGNHSMGLKADGTIVVWGNNYYGQYIVPSPNSGYTAMAADGFHSLGLKATPYFTFSISDVPDDQGGQLEVTWHKHIYDAASETNPVIRYDVQRLDSDWQTLVTVAAAQADSYSVDVTTPDILTIGLDEPYSRYRIIAWTNDPLVFFWSRPDSGYSIDNLSPDTPGLELYDSITSRILAWQIPGVPDFDETCIYRGSEPEFVPETPIVCSTATYFIETHLNRYWYKARSFDIHGNASEWSNEVVGQYPTGVLGAMPTVLRLYPNQPNPFNPTTTIKFDVPVDGRATLRVYDVRGALVRTLLDTDLPRGSYWATWDGRDASGRGMASGSYFARLEAGGKMETVRMSLVR